MITEITSTKYVTSLDAGALVTVIENTGGLVTALSEPGSQGPRGPAGIVPGATPPDNTALLWLDGEIIKAYDPDLEEWVAIVVGEQGPAGEQGIPGEQGLQGLPGFQGEAGPPGISVIPYVSDAPPNPADHPLWLDSTTSALYFWYVDADSEQWVSITGSAGAAGVDGLDAPAYERRHDFVAPYSYCGKAPEGTLVSASGWTLTRIELASDGTTTTAHASDSWDNRLTATYG